jgi:IS30 family transposase
MSRVNCSRKRLKGEHLKYQDRQRLDWYINENHYLSKGKRRSQRALATLLGTSPATITRELRRGEVELLDSQLRTYKSYSAEVAQANYAAKGSAKGRQLKIGTDHAFAKYVEEKILKQKYSPDAVIMELRRDGNPFETNICPRTLYSYIDKGVFLRVERSNLRRGGRHQKRLYEKVRRAHKGDGKGIEERPEAAHERQEAGHWEIDCVESGKGKGKACLLTMIDRKEREFMMFKLPSQTQAAVIAALDRMERQMGKEAFSRKFKSITSDNGSEFLDWRSVERSCFGEGYRTKQYFAHPNSSWERGSNENVNGIIRWFIPKGSAISAYSNKRIREIQDWINNLPRRILNGHRAKTTSARAEVA